MIGTIAPCGRAQGRVSAVEAGAPA